MKTLSAKPIHLETGTLSKTDIEYLQNIQYSQERHRALMEAFLVVIRGYPDADKKHIVSSFWASVNYVFPMPEEEKSN